MVMTEEAVGKKPSFGIAVMVVLVAALIIGYSVLKLEAEVHIPLVLCALFAALVGRWVLGIPWKTIEEGMINGIVLALQAVLILYIVGMIIGAWIQSGVVPSLIYYGLDLLSPRWFLLATLLICSVVSLSTGTSWGTTGTVGIALMGVAMGLGIPAPLAAGVVISGAYFGDKMSPLSDTTNLAPAIAGTDLFQHIRAMIWTTGPTYLLVCAITIILGMKYGGGTLDAAKISAIQSVMSHEFDISLLGFVPPVLVIALCVMKMPAIPGLFAGVVAGAVIAAFQGLGIGDIMNVIQNGYSATLSATLSGAEDLTAVAKALAENNIMGVTPEMAKEVGGMLSDLLTRGGMQSMNWTISLIICALSFGGIMERCGFLEVMLRTILKGVRSVGGLVASVIASCFICNVFLGDQYLSIVMPGRMFRLGFEEKGLHPRMLSRSLEDAGTLTSVLIPWNTCGAYNSGVLGVPTIEYVPYAFLNYLNPLMAILLTYLGIGTAWKGKDGEPVITKEKPANL
jgi:NhaC family Na+:H+ antiporter